MPYEVISKQAIKRRNSWTALIGSPGDSFASDSSRIQAKLFDEIETEGIGTLLEHLRLCGTIPEKYSQNSSEEKQYSKYTDSLLAASYQRLGCRSIVLEERGDAADVDAYAKNFSFVADAKAFRLSRTAKNQKDFKIQSLSGWRRDKDFAMLVCPIFQLPARSSQIYQQATTRNVCLFTYSHLSVLLAFAQQEGDKKSNGLMHEIFKTVSLVNSSKNAIDYWLAINRVMLSSSKLIQDLWLVEKLAALESLSVAKEEGLSYWAGWRDSIMRLNHEEALRRLLSADKVEQKIRTIKSAADNGLLAVEE